VRSLDGGGALGVRRGDQGYLRDVQYATTAKLDTRSFLHRTFSTSIVPLSLFEARLIDWPTDARVLE
jgi:hypothetical protein